MGAKEREAGERGSGGASEERSEGRDGKKVTRGGGGDCKFWGRKPTFHSSCVLHRCGHLGATFRNVIVLRHMHNPYAQRAIDNNNNHPQHTSFPPPLPVTCDYHSWKYD